MARKVTTYTINSNDRDKGKQFILTEMSAVQAEDWAIHALIALGAANVDIPEGATDLGMAALAEVGLKKLFAINPAVLKPLLTELMGCVQYLPDPSKPTVTINYPLFENQIEEAKTLFLLKWEVLKLHLSFLEAGSLSPSHPEEAPAQKMKHSTRMSQRS